jgi:hypothetical protein
MGHECLIWKASGRSRKLAHGGFTIHFHDPLGYIHPILCLNDKIANANVASSNCSQEILLHYQNKFYQTNGRGENEKK